MIAYVSRNIKHMEAKNGPLNGLVHEFVSKHGFPVFFFDRSDAVKLGDNFLTERAAKGMVGIDAFGQSIYTVLADGTASALPIQVTPIEQQFPEESTQKEHQLA